MSLSKFEVLNAVVDLGSLTRAGESLGLTQSAVSHAIASLEHEFGFAVLLRSRTGVSLTTNGERLLKPIREMLRWNERMKQEIAEINGLEVGSVRIGTFTSVSTQWLPGIIQEFNLRHPNIDVGLQEGNYEEIERWIAEGTVDFGFLSLPTAQGFDTIPLHHDRMLCIVPDNHPLHQANVLEFHHIAHEPFIMPKAGCDNDVRQIFTHHRAKPNVKFALDDDYAIVAMVRRGLGISILPEMVLSNIRNPVCALRLRDNPARTIALAARSLKLASPATRKFIDCTKWWLNQESIQVPPLRA